MKVRPLVISEAERARVREVREYAEHHRYPAAEVLYLMSHPERAPGLNPERAMVFPLGYRCVFTIEEQPCGWCRHLSVNVMEKKLLPSREAVAELCRQFGFVKPLDELIVHIMEETYDSVNVLELLETQSL